jgi:glycosyltransferase involved in cell wall biosynthesis
VPSLGGRGCYLIQSYETWSGPKSRVDRTFRLPLRRAAIATWLVELVAESAPGPVHLVPNAIDTSVFRLVNPIARRSSNEVAMLWHEMPAKGSRYGLEALNIARRSCPDLHATLFSAHRRPADLPDWITFVENASRSTVAEILNQAAVFISPSLCEGWPLPPAEALACGAALLSTDIPAVRDYAKDGQTAILVPPADPSAMAESLIRLLRDTAERTRIAGQGHDFVSSHFDWDRSTELLEHMFRDGSFSA